MPLRCKVFARLNNCANCDEADVSFVQTQKTQSLYFVWVYHPAVRTISNSRAKDCLSRAKPYTAVRISIFTHNTVAIMNHWFTIARASWDFTTKMPKIMLLFVEGLCFYKALFDKYACNFLLLFDWQQGIITDFLIEYFHFVAI